MALVSGNKGHWLGLWFQVTRAIGWGCCGFRFQWIRALGFGFVYNNGTRAETMV